MQQSLNCRPTATACFLVFGLTCVGMASWDPRAKLPLAMTVVYVCSMALTWSLFALGMLKIEGPGIDDYVAIFRGMSSSGVSVFVALLWSTVWTVGYMLGLAAVALLMHNLKPGWSSHGTR